MNETDASVRRAQCRCGAVGMELVGAPIMTVACYCRSCQKAAEQLHALSGAPTMVDADGGTHFVMQRKDRLQCRQGRDQLREHRLTPDATTRRVVAACCNTPMFLELGGGHWLSIYKDRLDVDDRPPLEIRTMTEGRRPGVVFNDGLPSPRRHTIGFMWKLFAAWVVMGFKNPKIDYVEGTIDG